MIVPAALTIAVAAAETVETPEIVIVGLTVYPAPAFVIVARPTTPVSVSYTHLTLPTIPLV